MPWPFNDKNDKQRSDIHDFQDMDNKQMFCIKCKVRRTFWKARVKGAVWVCALCGHQEK